MKKKSKVTKAKRKVIKLKPKTAKAKSKVTKTKPKAPAVVRNRILIVDDDPGILEIYSALLEDAGFIVDQAEHALAAIASVVRATPDLILADIRMPIVDGMGLVAELKAHSDSCDIPVVAITGYDSAESREEALKAGYAEYITKPINPRLFPSQIAKLIRKPK